MKREKMRSDGGKRGGVPVSKYSRNSYYSEKYGKDSVSLVY